MLTPFRFERGTRKAMTQQPFSRPGAIDLSALKGTSAPGAAGSAQAGAPAAGPAGQPGAGATSAYCVEISEQNFQSIVETSTTAPVLLVFFSRSRMPESGQLADDIETLSGEFEGKFLAGRVDIDAVPQIAQAMQIPSVPLVVVIVDGRPMPLLQDVVPLEELRTALTQVMQQLTTQGITGRHQPRTGGAAPPDGEEAEEMGDPRYAAAQDALGEGDIDTAVAEYQKLVDANPADAEAAAGLAMAQVLQRTQGVDLQTAREAAAAAPDDVDAQTMVADLDMLGGHVDDAFDRLVELVRRSEGDARNQARQHLLGLFGAVGNDDPRVLRGRQNLASALF
jgi:putative thioredoxin